MRFGKSVKRRYEIQSRLAHEDVQIIKVTMGVLSMSTLLIAFQFCLEITMKTKEKRKKEGSKSFSIVLLFEKILFYMEAFPQFCPIFHFQNCNFFKVLKTNGALLLYN